MTPPTTKEKVSKAIPCLTIKQKSCLYTFNNSYINVKIRYTPRKKNLWKIILICKAVRDVFSYEEMRNCLIILYDQYPISPNLFLYFYQRKALDFRVRRLDS